ncbi:Os04g0285801 [Oryza sativa Japonica Group]|uniref:Os04g0285801 protein n=1 Tax=Oryza sativa subsp. japonica TaxID=39947 RepID=A0A0P0W8D7_ORYSJ|nr:Os04g0285801 [Oryza sativa Japonica Group]
MHLHGHDALHTQVTNVLCPVAWEQLGGVAGPAQLDDGEQYCGGLIQNLTDAHPYYSIAATRLLGVAIGSDDDLWSFAWSVASPSPSAPVFPSHTSMATSRPRALATTAFNLHDGVVDGEVDLH